MGRLYLRWSWIVVWKDVAAVEWDRRLLCNGWPKSLQF
jgi:hypothetical protein